MFSQLIVPVDPWSTSTLAIRVAADLAAAIGATVEVVAITAYPEDREATANMLSGIVAQHGPLAVEPTRHVLVATSVAEAIAERFAMTDGALIVMNSHGRGRSASVLGSTTTELLVATGAPIVVVGPNAVDRPTRIDGAYVVPLDGSERADGILPIVADWTRAFGGEPWLVEATDGDTGRVSDDAAPADGLVSRAQRLGDELGRSIPFDTLPDGRTGRTGRTILDFAERHDASFVFMSTHGRTGMARLRAGSVAADVIRHSECPVVMFRPSELGNADTAAEIPRPA